MSDAKTAMKRNFGKQFADAEARDRGTGRTTHQMQSAAQGANFVWCNQAISYPQQLARYLGCADLVVRPLSWLQLSSVVGRDFQAGVHVDHAALLGRDADEALHYLSLSWVRTGARRACR